MQQRYKRNYPIITHSQQSKLADSRVLIVGCGGLGGHLSELLARIGVGNLFIADPDVFEASNLNRQRFSSIESLGELKATSACRQLQNINPYINITPIDKFIDDNYIFENTNLFDVVLDATDNIKSRLILEKGCEKAEKLLIHAAVSGNIGQIAVVRPGSKLISRIYATCQSTQKPNGVIATTVAITAGHQANECLNALLHPQELLPENSLLLINNRTSQIIHIHE